MNVQLSQRHRATGRRSPTRCKRPSSSTSTFWLATSATPSLHAKKYDEAEDLWQARVNQDWRFYFTIAADAYRVENLTPHPK